MKVANEQPDINNNTLLCMGNPLLNTDINVACLLVAHAFIINRAIQKSIIQSCIVIGINDLFHDNSILTSDRLLDKCTLVSVLVNGCFFIQCASVVMFCLFVWSLVCLPGRPCGARYGHGAPDSSNCSSNAETPKSMPFMIQNLRRQLSDMLV